MQQPFGLEADEKGLKGQTGKRGGLIDDRKEFRGVLFSVIGFSIL